MFWKKITALPPKKFKTEHRFLLVKTQEDFDKAAYLADSGWNYYTCDKEFLGGVLYEMTKYVEV